MKFRMDPVDDFSGRHLQEFLDRLNAGWFTEFFFYWVLQGFTGFYRVKLRNTLLNFDVVCGLIRLNGLKSMLLLLRLFSTVSFFFIYPRILID